MILSGDQIEQSIGSDIEIEPFHSENLNPNSYNLSLHHELLIYEEVVLDAAAPNRYRRIEIPSEGLTLRPKYNWLGCSTNPSSGIVYRRNRFGRCMSRTISS